MRRNFHLQFINNPDYFGTAAEVLAEKIESLIINKSHSFCDDSIDWDFHIEKAQCELLVSLNLTK